MDRKHAAVQQHAKRPKCTRPRETVLGTGLSAGVAVIGKIGKASSFRNKKISRRRRWRLIADRIAGKKPSGPRAVAERW